MNKATFFQSVYAPTDQLDIILPRLQQHPELVRQVIETADNALNKKFVFNMEWDLERTDVPVIFKSRIDWAYQPADDQEFVWAFNRHQFLVCLAQAYVITGEAKYAQGYVDLITDFIHAQPISAANRNTTWRILEIGFRTERWLQAVYLLKASPALPDSVLTEIYQSLLVHQTTLLAENKPYNYSTNWGIFENFGLFLNAILLPENADSKRALQESLTYLNRALHTQIQADGVQVEQSALYHNEVLRAFLTVILLAKRLDLTLPEGFGTIVHQMAMASRYLAKPDGTQLLYGDSDVQHLTTPWQLAAVVFQDGRFKQAAAEALSYENAWLFTAKEAASFNALAVQQPEQTSIALQSSGHFVMRSSWQKDANMLHMHCGQIGSGHGHSDLLHLDWLVNGQDVLVDAGRYTYVDKPERYQFKMMPAHNTIMVDGVDAHHYANSWDLTTVVDELKTPLIQGPGFEFFAGGHDGYMQLPNPVYVTRKVLHLLPDLYLVIDQLKTSGKHHYQQAFHYDARGMVTLKDHVARFASGPVVATTVFDPRMQVALAASEQSDHYNSKIPNQQVIATGDFTGSQTLFTVLANNAPKRVQVAFVPVQDVKRGIVLPAQEAQALKLTNGDQRFLVIAAPGNITHGTNLFQVEGHYTEAPLTFFDLNADEEWGTVVSW